MKKIFMLSLLIVLGTMAAFSQTLDDVYKFYNLQRFKEARTAIDKILTEEKSAAKADAWYYKGKIYNALSYDSTITKKESFDLKSVAFDALKKSQSLDAKDTRLKEEDHKSYLDLYYGMYDLGATEFNKKQYESSFNSFKKALDIKDYILEKKYIYPDAPMVAFDTALILNTAVAATQAKMMPEAITYYTKIVDANVGGPGYQEIYGFLVDYYAKNKDEAKFNDIMAKARAKYPKDSYWDELELAQIPKSTDKTALYAKYDELVAKNPDNYNLAYNYAVEIYNSLYGNDTKPKDMAAAKAKLTSVLKGAIANDKGIDATVLMANHQYNIAADYSSDVLLIKGTKPEDVKKKAELKKAANTAMDETIPYAEAALKYLAAQPKLKATQQANQKVIIGYMIDMYGLKGDKVKVAEYEKQRTALN